MNDPKVKTCSKCQSPQMMYPIEVVGDVQTPIPVQLKLTSPKEPGAWINIRLPDRFTISAAVCGECGHTEFYTEEPQKMWAKWQAGYR